MYQLNNSFAWRCECSRNDSNIHPRQPRLHSTLHYLFFPGWYFKILGASRGMGGGIWTFPWGSAEAQQPIGRSEHCHMAEHLYSSTEIIYLFWPLKLYSYLTITPLNDFTIFLLCYKIVKGTSGCGGRFPLWYTCFRAHSHQHNTSCNTWPLLIRAV